MIVSKSIRANIVDVGIPCRVVNSIDDYNNFNCKSRSLEEAKLYVRCFRERNGRNPKTSEFWEEYLFFIDKGNVSMYSKC